jgi:hypothetical protein
VADKPKRTLPSPPYQPSALENMLSGIKGYFGIGNQADVDPWDLWLKPVAQSRITKTPIYQADTNERNWGEGQLAEYNPDTDSIAVRPSSFQGSASSTDPNPMIPHESAHAIYEKSKLVPASVLKSGMPSGSRMQSSASGSPFSVTPFSFEEQWRQDKSRANEGLAYSIGLPEATPFIESVASQIRDPNIAQQLRRLHYNALNAKRLP